MNINNYRSYNVLIIATLSVFVYNIFWENKHNDTISREIILEKSESLVRCYNGGKIFSDPKYINLKI